MDSRTGSASQVLTPDVRASGHAGGPGVNGKEPRVCRPLTNKHFVAPEIGSWSKLISIFFTKTC